MYKSICMINSMMLHSFEDNAGISWLTEVLNELERQSQSHELLSLLLFKHGFIQICSGLLNFFCFYFMSNKYYLNAIKS